MHGETSKVSFAVNGIALDAFERNGKMFFNVDEVLTRLEYRDQQSAIARHCKDDIDITTVPGGRYITEGDFYRLVFRSRKPEAKAFVRWVCHDVLPSIRKHGFYGTKSFAEQIKSATPDEIRDFAKRLLAERDERRGDKAADDAYWPPHLRSDAQGGGVIKSRADLKKWLAKNATTTAINNNALPDVSPNCKSATTGRESGKFEAIGRSRDV